MLRLEDLQQFIDLEVRQEIIDTLMTKDVQAEINRRWAKAKIRPSPFKPLPEDLWGIIPLIVDVPGDHGTTTEVVEASEHTIRLYGATACPDPMWTDFTMLNEQQAQQYSAYLTTYISYLLSIQASLEASVFNWDYMRKQMLDLLHVSYYKSVSKSDRDRLA